MISSGSSSMNAKKCRTDLQRFTILQCFKHLSVRTSLDITLVIGLLGTVVPTGMGKDVHADSGIPTAYSVC